MFGSVVLEIFLGLAFLFLILSLVVTTLQELLSGAFGMRAGNLVQALRNLLDEDGGSLSAQVLGHPVLKRLYRGQARGALGGLIGRGPSYIPSHAFATALLDTLRRQKAGGSASPISMEDLFGRAPDIVRNMADGSLKDVLTLMIGQMGDADRPLQRRVDSIEQRMSVWFDETMDRASGWYKRKAQMIGIVLAAALTVAIDADALRFMQQLWADSALRMAMADAAAAATGGDGSAPAGLAALLDQLALFPLGWAEGETLASRFADAATGLRSVAGWLITTLAVSLGSAFWFDLTKKALNLRASGPRPQDGDTERG